MAVAAFGGALVGGLVELLTDRTDPAPNIGLTSRAPAPTPSTTGTSPRTQPTVTTTKPTAPTSVSPTSAPTPVPPAGPAVFAAAEALAAELTALPRTKNVAFGVGVLDAVTGRRFVFETGSPFEMASTVKVDILVATYLRARDARRDLTASEKKLASAMIRSSDNAAASTLFRAAGRAAGLTKTYQRMGMTATTAASAWGLTKTTAGDRLIVLDALARGGGALSAADGSEILALMRSVAADQRWGIGGVDQAGETVAVKNGWLPRDNQAGRWIVSTSGLLTGGSTDLRLAVCSRGHSSQAIGIDFVETVLRTARETLGV